MRRTNWKTVSTLITMGLVAGCAEKVSAPQVTPSSAPASVRMAPPGRPALSLSGNRENNESADFVVGPNGGVFVVGNQAVSFPANSICEPVNSGYGIGTWDLPCSPLSKNITIHAVTRVTGARTQVDFSPSLRFVPSTDPSNWVWLFMYNPSAVGATDLSAFKIYYAPTLNGPVIDESLTDSRRRTYVDTRTGMIFSAVAHFSGYTSMGRCDTPPPSDTGVAPTC